MLANLPKHKMAAYSEDLEEYLAMNFNCFLMQTKKFNKVSFYKSFLSKTFKKKA